MKLDTLAITAHSDNESAVTNSGQECADGFTREHFVATDYITNLI